MARVSARVRAGVACGLAMAFGLAVLLVGGPIHAKERGPVLKVGVDDSPAGWDPHVNLDWRSSSHWEQIYESLVQFGPGLDVEPALAESWEQPDARAFVFRLRRGVLFHHTRQVVAGDVTYSLERAKSLGAGAPGGALEGMQSVEALDMYTVRVTLSAPDAGFLSRLAANRGSAIVPREVVERHGTLKAAIVGTGPFRIKKYEAGHHAELERNPSYWAKGLPRVDGLLFLVMKDEAARIGDLRRGAIDIASVSDPRLADVASADAGLRVEAPPPARAIELWLRTDRPPFKAKKVRQGLSAALDRGLLIKAALLGHGAVTSALPPASTYAMSAGEVARLPFYRRDLALSRRLLAESGHPRGLGFKTLVADDIADLLATARAVQSQLEEGGIKMSVQAVPSATLMPRWRAGDAQALLTAGNWAPDPDGYVRPLFFSSKSGGESDQYHSPEVERLIGLSRTTLDPARRVDLWRKVQAILADEVPVVWLLARPVGFELTRTSVMGYRPRPDLSRANLKYASLGR